MPKKVILLILDGWGEGKPDKFNAIDNARTPNMDFFRKEYPNILLKADGKHVGLPEGQMGTSEVNHRVIGTGRIILQDLPMIDTSIEDQSFFSNPVLQSTVSHVKQHNSAFHLVGILSDGGIHSHINHLFALLELFKREQIQQPAYIHVFTDGRDTPPKSAEKYLQQLEDKIKEIGVGIIATVQGRFYLDRDREWSRTDTAFQLIRSHQGIKKSSWQEALAESYKEFDNDQYHKQYYFDDNVSLKENDAVVFFNFRTDRNYQIIKRTLDEQIPNLKVVTFINPSQEFKVEEVFKRQTTENSLAKIISDQGKVQYHLTETEKYVHLTYFFNGEREEAYTGEEWKLIQSNRFVKPLYNFEPSMRAFEIAQIILDKIEENKTDFMVVNFAITDMVGHTGNYEAALIGAEAVDYCLGKIYEKIKDKLNEYVVMVTADHGNSDEMWDYVNNQPHTQHTLNPVPFVVLTEPKVQLNPRDQLLSNIAPTILDFMELPKPVEMTGESLLQK